MGRIFCKQLSLFRGVQLIIQMQLKVASDSGQPPRLFTKPQAARF